MSENFHPYLQETEPVIIAHDSFVWHIGNVDALYDHLEDIITDVVTGETDSACLRLRLLMCACTMAAERQG